MYDGSSTAHEPMSVTRVATGEDFLHAMADIHHHGDTYVAARRFLGDLRKGHLGRLALEAPPARVRQTETTRNEGGAAGGGRGGDGMVEVREGYQTKELLERREQEARARARHADNGEPKDENKEKETNEQGKAEAEAVESPFARMQAEGSFEGW